ncbi:MAG: deoxyribonuclease V [Acidobacteriota bacterium]
MSTKGKTTRHGARRLPVRIRRLHAWDVSVEEAVDIQNRLAKRLEQATLLRGKLRTVAGADISYDRRSDRIWAALVVFSHPSLEIVERRVSTCRVRFPYIPGLLSFREVPPLLGCFEDLDAAPDVLLLDGQGIAHPRGLGLASHVGLLTGVPSIGCAKSRLVGEHGRVATRAGSFSPLYYSRRKVGVVLRTRDAVRPLYVSCGYGITLRRAISTVLSCVKGYRVPEPLRAAHILANRARQSKSVHVDLPV